MSFYIMYNTKDRGFRPAFNYSEMLTIGPYPTEDEAVATAESLIIRKFTLLKEEGTYEMEPLVAYKKTGGK